jgi:N-acetylglutamate synthase-like GNAT family acetyltransferase
MDIQIIYEKIKKAKELRLINNCYNFNVVENSTKLWEAGDDFLFAYADHGIQRLIYFGSNWDAVDELLKQVKNGRYLIEFMTKRPDEHKPAGSALLARMMRLANYDCRTVFSEDSAVAQYMDLPVGEKAKVEDVNEIDRILRSTFHTEISHLPSKDEIKSRIDQFTVHKSEGNIDALLQTNVMPKKFYINQVVNKGDRKNIHAILLNELKKYIKDGGKYLYAWVEDTNMASLKFHEKYGMKHDGMWSMIYCLER